MSPDQIFVILLLVACVSVIGWMSISSHRAAGRRASGASPETGPPAENAPKNNRA